MGEVITLKPSRGSYHGYVSLYCYVYYSGISGIIKKKKHYSSHHTTIAQSIHGPFRFFFSTNILIYVYIRILYYYVILTNIPKNNIYKPFFGLLIFFPPRPLLFAKE